MNNTIKFYFHILSIFAFISFPLYAKTKLNVVTEEWRPFNYTNENGDITGLVTERLKAILDDKEISYEISSKTWDTSMNLAKNVENTLIYTIERTEDRESSFQWVCPLVGPVPVNLYKLSIRKDIQIKELNDAKNYIISIEKGESDHETLKSQGFVDGKHLKVTSDPYEGPRQFFANKVDLVIQSGPEMDHYLKHFNHSRDEVVKLIELREMNGCLAFGLKTDKKLVEKVRRALLEHNNNFPLSEL